jgi:hypothetical protein
LAVVVVQVIVLLTLDVTVGATVFCVTFVTAVLVQPLVALVTLKVYEPAALALVFCVVVDPLTLGPDHRYVSPVAGVPFKATVVALQVNVPVVLAEGIGAVVFCVTVTFDDREEQPAPEVAISEYTPGKFMVGDKVVAPDTIPGPDQLYEIAPTAEPVKVVDVFTHVNVRVVPALAVGNGLTVTATVVDF